MNDRQDPIKPLGDKGPVFYDLWPGDRVKVTISGATGTLVKRCTPKRDGWVVRWDNPVFGVTEGRVAWANLEPLAETSPPSYETSCNRRGCRHKGACGYGAAG